VTLAGHCPGCSVAFVIDHRDLLFAECSECDELLHVRCDGCCRPFTSSQLTDGECEDCREAARPARDEYDEHGAWLAQQRRWEQPCDR
jgi:hypothetical protein